MQCKEAHKKRQTAETLKPKSGCLLYCHAFRGSWRNSLCREEWGRVQQRKVEIDAQALPAGRYQQLWDAPQTVGLFTSAPAFDFAWNGNETARPMIRRILAGSRSPAAPLVLALSLALGLTGGCKKKEAAAGPPPGAFASTVAAAQVVVQPIAETLAVVGTLIANEYVEIEAESDGTVAEILFQEGQPVKKGDLLVRLDETKFAASLAEAEANFKLSETTYERTKSLLRDHLISQQEHDQAAATFHANKAAVELRQRLLKDARIHAPFSGVVGSRLVSPGQVIKQMGKNTTITTLVDLDTVKAEFHVPERFVSELRVGQAVEIKAAAFPKEKFKGEVFFLAPQVDAATRTLLVKARIPNESRRLRPGMFVNLDLTLTLNDNALVIPESSLVSQGDKTFVYVISPENTAELRPVTIGLRLPNKLEVTRGLKAGETVVAEGLQKVRPGGAVKVAAESPSAGTGSNATVRTGS